MQSEWNFGLKQKFNIKCLLDLIVFVIACIIFIFFAKANGISPYDTFVFLAVIIGINSVIYFATKQWILKSIKNTLTLQSDSLSETTEDIMSTINSQKRIFETLTANTKIFLRLLKNLKLYQRSHLQLLKTLKNK